VAELPSANVDRGIIKSLTHGTEYGTNIFWCKRSGKILTHRCLELLDKARNNPTGLRFSELGRLCRCIGMILDRAAGSHLIYKLERPFFLLSIQRTRDGKAKPYQVRQLIDFIEENGLDSPSVKE